MRRRARERRQKRTKTRRCLDTVACPGKWTITGRTGINRLRVCQEVDRNTSDPTEANPSAERWDEGRRTARAGGGGIQTAATTPPPYRNPRAARPDDGETLQAVGSVGPQSAISLQGALPRTGSGRARPKNRTAGLAPQRRKQALKKQNLTTKRPDPGLPTSAF